MGRPSTRALLFYQELEAVRAALELLPEHHSALQRVAQHLIANERTRLANARHNGKGPVRTVEHSMAFGKALMALPSEQERLKACRLASALQKAKDMPAGLPRMGWWGGVISKGNQE